MLIADRTCSEWGSDARCQMCSAEKDGSEEAFEVWIQHRGLYVLLAQLFKTAGGGCCEKNRPDVDANRSFELRHQGRDEVPR